MVILIQLLLYLLLHLGILSFSPVGATVSQSLPNITGSGLYTNRHNTYSFLGALKRTGRERVGIYASGNAVGAECEYLFDASYSSDIYQTNAPVRPSSLVTNFFIKF